MPSIRSFDPGISRDNWDANSRTHTGHSTRRLHHSVRPTPGPRKQACETLARSPAATSPPDASRFPAPLPPARKSPEIRGKTEGCPAAIPECEHQPDRVAEGAVSSEPVSPRIWASARRLLNLTACYVRTNDRSGVHRDRWIPDPAGPNDFPGLPDSCLARAVGRAQREPSTVRSNSIRVLLKTGWISDAYTLCSAPMKIVRAIFPMA